MTDTDRADFNSREAEGEYDDTAAAYVALDDPDQWPIVFFAGMKRSYCPVCSAVVPAMLAKRHAAWHHATERTS